MFKKSIAYTDLNGVNCTDDFYFNLTKTDLDNQINRTIRIESHDLTNCKNCGAPLPGYPCKCEYCGTVYDNAIGSGVAGDGPYQMHVGCLDKLLMTGVISINDYRRILLSEY